MNFTSRCAATALALLCATPAPAQSTIPPLSGIAHVAIRVKDLAASRAFYESLGFQQAFDLRKNDIPYESFIKLNDHQFLELYPVSAKDPTPAFLHLCFEGEDLEAIHSDYLAHGLTPIPVRKAGAGNLLFTMPGPLPPLTPIPVRKAGAGNLLFTMPGPLQPIGPAAKPIPQNIEYTQYQDGSLHSNDFGQHLGADRIADRLLGVSLAMQDPAGARDFYINQLSFKPLPGQQMTMHLPGNSGQQVDIVPAASLGAHARITLDTENLSRAARHLSHQHIKFVKSPDALAFEDPDGNQIILQQK